jgi:hypothetical protein
LILPALTLVGFDRGFGREASMTRSCGFACGLLAIASWFAVPTVGGHSCASPAAESALELPGEKFNRLANNPTVKRDERAGAVFALFKQHFKQGGSPRQLRRLLRDANWVKHAELHYFGILMGFVPVDCNFKDRTYSLLLFADKHGDSDWVIFFQLEGDSAWGKWHEDGLAFLHGEQGSHGESRIKEIALCYPDGNCEKFRGR